MANIETKPAHSEIGASSMERWANCPGSVRLSRGLPNQSSVYAQEGTEAHELAAEWLQKGKLPPDNTDEETFEAIKLYVDHVQKRIKNLSRHPLSKVMIEHRFDLSQIYPGLFGTADCAIYDGEEKVLYVSDYKHGKGVPVDPEDNPQLKYYGLGALLSLGVPIDYVVLEIIQPRYSTDIKEAIKVWKCDALEMLDFANDLKIAAAATNAPDAPVKTGDWCQFCRARAICPALKEAAQIAVEEDFGLHKLSELDPIIISDLLDRLDAVEFWCKGVREFAYLEAKAGRTPPGYKLVPKRATRKWADPEAAEKLLSREIHSSVFKDCLTNPELKSPAQVEKILGKSNKPLVDSLTVSISSGDTLVHESDKREASSLKRGQEMFPVLE